MKFKAGVLSGDEVTEVLNDAKAHGYALPAVNVISTNSVNAVLETARDLNSPVVVQFSNGGEFSTQVRHLTTKIRKLLFLAL